MGGGCSAEAGSPDLLPRAAHHDPPTRVEEGRLVAPDLQRQQRSCGRIKMEEKGRLAALQAEEGGPRNGKRASS